MSFFKLFDYNLVFRKNYQENFDVLVEDANMPQNIEKLNSII